MRIERFCLTDEKSSAQAFAFPDGMITSIAVFQRVVFEGGNLWGRCVPTLREENDGWEVVELRFRGRRAHPDSAEAASKNQLSEENRGVGWAGLEPATNALKGRCST